MYNWFVNFLKTNTFRDMANAGDHFPLDPNRVRDPSEYCLGTFGGNVLEYSRNELEFLRRWFKLAYEWCPADQTVEGEVNVLYNLCCVHINNLP